MEKKCIDYALEYHSRGWNVIPVKANKQPRSSFKRWLTEKQTQEDVQELFSDWNQGIGIIVGEVSNLSVVDVDVTGYIDDMPKIGKTSDLPFTYMVKTPSGGYHYYYQWSGIEKAHDVGKKDGNGRDYKNSGGYVVAPPTKVSYEKHGKKIDGEYYVTLDQSLEPYPVHLSQPQKVQAKGLIASKESTSEKITSEATKILKSGAREGGRNNALFTLVLELGQDYRPGSKQIFKSIVATWNRTKVQPPIEPEEFEATFESAWSKAQTKRNEFFGKRIEKQKQEEPEIVKTSRLYDVVKEDLKDFLGDGTKKIPYYETGIPWIDEGMGGLQKRTIVSAPTNTGKTLLAIQIARSVINLGKPVLYIDFESSPVSLFTRLMVTGTEYSIEDMILNGKQLARLDTFDENKRTAVRIDTIDTDRLESIEQLHESIIRWQEKYDNEGLIILDQINGLRGLSSEDEKINKENMVATWIKHTMRKSPSTILVLSPQSKADTNGSTALSVAGSAELGYAPDCILNLVQRINDIEVDGKVQKEPFWDHKSLTVHVAKTRATCVTDYSWPAKITSKAEIHPLDISKRLGSEGQKEATDEDMQAIRG